MSINSMWDTHLDVTVLRTERYEVGEADLPLPTNPFGISRSNFTDIGKFDDCLFFRRFTTDVFCAPLGDDCAWSGSKANISNALILCGMMRGTPKRISPGSPMLFEDKSRWSQPVSSNHCHSVPSSIHSVTLF